MTPMTTATTMYDLEVELQADGSVNLSQHCGSGNTEYCSLHRAQVQHIAELAGLIRPLAGTEEQAPGIAELERTYLRLQRTLMLARLQAEELQHDLAVVAQAGHENLDIELAHAHAMNDFLSFACGEFEDSFRAEAALAGVTAVSPGTAERQLWDTARSGAKQSPKGAPNPPFGAAPKDLQSPTSDGALPLFNAGGAQ